MLDGVVDLKEERSVMLAQMPVKKLLIKLSVPAIIAMLFNALYNLVDTVFVAWGAGEIAIGALSIAFPVQMIVLAIGLMIGMGSASIFSRAYGRNDALSMQRAVHTALGLSFVLSVLIAGIGIIFLEDVLRIFGATSSNIDYARDYLFYILIGLVPFSLSIVLNNLARAEGRANVAMISMLIGALVNIILDPIFIFDFALGLGVTGAAIATVIAKTASFIYVFSASLSKHSTLNIRISRIFIIDFKMIGEIFVIGAPTLIRNTLGAFLVVIINNLINAYAVGDPAIYISIYGVINRLIMFLLLPGFGLVQGMQPIVGFNFGAKLNQRLFDVLGYGMRLVQNYFIIVIIVSLVSADWLFMAFSRNADPYFIAYGARAFRIIAIGFILISYQLVLSIVYQAMGYPVRALFITLSRQFIFFIPLAFTLTFFFGLSGVWLTFLVSDLIAGILSLIIFKLEMKILERKLAT